MEYQEMIKTLLSTYAVGASVFLLIYFVLFLIFVFSYALSSLCYIKFFRAYNYEHPYYGFIPYYRYYILANLTCDEYFDLGEFKIERKYFSWWWIVFLVLNFIPFIKIIGLVIKIICLGFCYNKGIKKLDPTYNGNIISYLAVVFPIILWIIILPKKNYLE